MSVEIITPVGRLVGGHPMVAALVTDDRDQPVMKADGVTQAVETYIGVAIPKQGETHWNQTEWGRKIVAQAHADWPNGEHGAPTFAWKITDGDSAVPNKKGKKPCDREGYPGHWIINASTRLGTIKCYHAGRYEPHQVIQDKNAIKCGDYCRVVLQVRGNAPSQSPGVYVNPELFELTRAGIEIVTSNAPSAAATFGASPAPQLPPGAMIDPNVQTPAPAQAASMPATPHTAFVANAGATPVRMMTAKANGVSYEQFRTLGYDDARLIAEGYMIG